LAGRLLLGFKALALECLGAVFTGRHLAGYLVILSYSTGNPSGY
jgi:hypothetical protein